MFQLTKSLHTYTEIKLHPRANKFQSKTYHIFHANGDQKKAGVAILISDKIDFETKVMKRDKEGHYIMIKGSIQGGDIAIINIYATNIGASQYIRQMLRSIKGEINSNTIIVEDFDTPLTPTNRSTKQKISKETNFK
ncbi:hypothetical protein FD755_010124 [Muntiacus reevesi]|uniref:Uncharacterized protein n=1 Tax=Muntiacus reevesi TaxID=9886 RepID=A0A5N3Y0X3_MUNRE|nr:hypothetical protein FD755_010124 [Muntiacus reevesi]